MEELKRIFWAGVFSFARTPIRWVALFFAKHSGRQKKTIGGVTSWWLEIEEGAGLPISEEVTEFLTSTGIFSTIHDNKIYCALERIPEQGGVSK